MAAPNSARCARLTLLVRAYCHLCDEMRDDLRAIDLGPDLIIDEIDVDADATLADRWGDKVPVLLAGERELCHYRLDRDILARYVGGNASPQATTISR